MQMEVIKMPPVSFTLIKNELDYLKRVMINVERDKLKKRIMPVFDVFTQHLSEKRKQRTLDRVLNSIFVIDERKDTYTVERTSGTYFEVGLEGNSALYKLGLIEVAEYAFDDIGYLERALILKLGTMDMFNRIITHYGIAANAVSAFYIGYSAFGLLKEGHGLFDMDDVISLRIAKHLIPIELQRKGTRELAYRIGNQARKIEQEKPNTGLQYIYELTR